MFCVRLGYLDNNRNKKEGPMKRHQFVALVPIAVSVGLLALAVACGSSEDKSTATLSPCATSTKSAASPTSTAARSGAATSPAASGSPRTGSATSPAASRRGGVGCHWPQRRSGSIYVALPRFLS